MRLITTMNLCPFTFGALDDMGGLTVPTEASPGAPRTAVDAEAPAFGVGEGARL